MRLPSQVLPSSKVTVTVPSGLVVVVLMALFHWVIKSAKAESPYVQYQELQ
jgi:hypothetical protein